MKTLDEICGVEIAKQIRANDPNLTRLELIGRGDNDIDDEDLFVLVGALEKNPHIIYLDLSENSIMAEGIKQLIRLKNIRKLNLTANNIGDEGATLLANMTQLTDLDISGNNITNIDQLLRELSSLEFLYIGGNGITDVNSELISSKQLKVLYLDKNLIKQELPIPQEQRAYVPLFSLLAGYTTSSPPNINENIKQSVDSLKTMSSKMGTDAKLYIAAMIIEDLGLSEVVKKNMKNIPPL